MKILAITLSLIAVTAFAQDQHLEIIGVGSATPPAAASVTHLFWSPSVEITLAVEGALGSQMELRADLFQLSDSLAAPLVRDLPTGPPVSFKNSTRRKLSVSLPLPKLQRQTQLQVRFKTKKEGDWAKIGQATLVVYPADYLKDVELGNQLPLVVFGGDGRLAEFFKRQKIKFEEIGQALPETPQADRLYLGRAGAKELSQWQEAHPEWKGNLVVFTEAAAQLPGVFSQFSANQRISKVTLPILDQLGTDPRSQKTVIDLINSITQQNQ